VHFEYSKKTSRERGPALIGIEIAQKSDLQGLIDRMNTYHVEFTYINDKPDLFEFLV
jgi:threonine dehydratase